MTKPPNVKGRNKRLAQACRPWASIVCVHRTGDPELQDTLASAAESAGDGAKVIAVEDKDQTGPGRNRDRGIMAATDADVIIIIDAHMRFQGDVLAQMANQVRKHGGLICPLVHHHDRMTFDGRPMAGASIAWMATDHHPQFSPLSAAWSGSAGPRPCTAVKGDCYAFRRQWYLDAGRPLAMLAGWGGDEEALSIAAWLCGEPISVFDGHVARPIAAGLPWPAPSAVPMVESRAALVKAFVIEYNARNELMYHLRLNKVTVPGPLSLQAEVDRVKVAMLKQAVSFEDWRRVVYGTAAAGEARKPGQPLAKISNPTVMRKGITCPHCGTFHEVGLTMGVVNVYPNGNRRHICPVCHLPFISLPARADAQRNAGPVSPIALSRAVIVHDGEETGEPIMKKGCSAFSAGILSTGHLMRGRVLPARSYGESADYYPHKDET